MVIVSKSEPPNGVISNLHLLRPEPSEKEFVMLLLQFEIKCK